MKTLLLIISISAIVAAQPIAEGSSEENGNPWNRQVRNQVGNSNGPGPNRRPPPPPAYYVETPSENGRRVYQKNRAEEKIHEQLGVLGAVAEDNRQRNGPSESPTNQNQNQNQGQSGRNQNQNSQNPMLRPPQYNRW